MTIDNAKYHNDFKKLLAESANPNQAHQKLVALHGPVITQRQAYRWAKKFAA